MDVNHLIESPVFVCGASRSGTTLLMNLFDGHPNLMVFPHELHFLEHYRKKKFNPSDFFRTEFLNQKPQSFYCNSVSLSQHNNYMFRTYGPCSEFNFGNHNFDKFRSIYKENIKYGNKLKDIISSWAKAFFYSNNPGWVDYEPHCFVDKRPLDNEIYAIDLIKEFPRAKFIHLIRHPKGRYASVKKRLIVSSLPARITKRLFEKKNTFRKFTEFLDRVSFKHVNYRNKTDFVTAFCANNMLTMKLALENEKEIGKDKYLVIRYEDLVQSRKTIMERIRKFLKINKSPLLFRQTLWRMPRRAISSFYSQYIDVTNVDPIDRANKNFEKITSVSERYLFNFYLSDIAEKFGYYLPSVGKGELLRIIRKPFKYERIRDYILMRPKILKIIKDYENKPLDILWFEIYKNGENIQD